MPLVVKTDRLVCFATMANGDVYVHPEAVESVEATVGGSVLRFAHGQVSVLASVKEAAERLEYAMSAWEQWLAQL
jgi:hypothetical protein